MCPVILDLLGPDCGTVSRLTDNTKFEYAPAISGNNVVWHGLESSWEVFFYDGSTTTQLTSNSTEDLWPTISGTDVVWQGWDGSDWEIYKATYTPTVVPLPAPAWLGLGLLALLGAARRVRHFRGLPGS